MIRRDELHDSELENQNTNGDPSSRNQKIPDSVPNYDKGSGFTIEQDFSPEKHTFLSYRPESESGFEGSQARYHQKTVKSPETTHNFHIPQQNQGKNLALSGDILYDHNLNINNNTYQNVHARLVREEQQRTEDYTAKNMPNDHFSEGSNSILSETQRSHNRFQDIRSYYENNSQNRSEKSDSRASRDENQKEYEKISENDFHSQRLNNRQNHFRTAQNTSIFQNQTDIKRPQLNFYENDSMKKYSNTPIDYISLKEKNDGFTNKPTGPGYYQIETHVHRENYNSLSHEHQGSQAHESNKNHQHEMPMNIPYILKDPKNPNVDQPSRSSQDGQNYVKDINFRTSLSQNSKITDAYGMVQNYRNENMNRISHTNKTFQDNRNRFQDIDSHIQHTNAHVTLENQNKNYDHSQQMQKNFHNVDIDPLNELYNLNTEQRHNYISNSSSANNNHFNPSFVYDSINDQPLYVNVKQYSYIRKRKVRRDFLDTLMQQNKQNGYLHESRHRHAMNRKRAPSGRFLTKAETEALKNQERDQFE